MPLFLQRLFHLACHAAAAFSAVLLLLCLFLWPYSHRLGAALEFATARHALGLGSHQGQVSILIAEAEPDEPLQPGFLLTPCIADHGNRKLLPGWGFAAWGDEAEPGFDGIVSRNRFLGLEARIGLPGYWRALYLDIPFPHLLLLTALPPALWLRRFLRRRRAQRARGFPVTLPPSPSEPRP